MSLPFDVTMKELVAGFVPDYQHCLHLDDLAPLHLVNVDLSTLSAATDIVLAEGDPPTFLVDLNFQSGPDEKLDKRVLMYQAVLHYQYETPVHSVILLLRPAADHACLTGRLHYEGRRGRGKMDFTYEVVRLWQQPVEEFLQGGLGTLPLAPLCRLPGKGSLEQRLKRIIQRIDERLDREAEPEERATLLTATFVLLGMRVADVVAQRLFQGVQIMKESSTYQLILREGEEVGLTKGQLRTLHETVLRLGQHRFGRPGKKIKEAVQAINDIRQLERMTVRLLDVSSWKELLDVE